MAAARNRQRAAAGCRRVAEADRVGDGGNGDEVDELLVVGVIDPAEPRHPAGEGARIGVRIGELEATAGRGQEGDVGGAPGQHIDNAVADLDDAAVDHRAAGDLHQAAGRAGEERAGITDDATHYRGAAARSFDQRAGANLRSPRRFLSRSALIGSADVAMGSPSVARIVHGNCLQDLNGPRRAPRTDWAPRGSRPGPACGSSGSRTHPLPGGGPFGSVSRETIYRLKLLLRRVQKPKSEPGAAMQEIADWLEKLGMSEYARRFAENGISAAALPHLTDQDLKDMGVLLGHRRILLAAIRELAGDSSVAKKTAATGEAKARDTAERRQVTVMFSDLVGSTALSARMDPEDLREIISSYQKCVAETVQRFGGFVAKYMGDGVLIYFGYPQAHEDDAERAVCAVAGVDCCCDCT